VTGVGHNGQMGGLTVHGLEPGGTTIGVVLGGCMMEEVGSNWSPFIENGRTKMGHVGGLRNYG
jgi:hypothetical protein